MVRLKLHWSVILLGLIAFLVTVQYVYVTFSFEAYLAPVGRAVQTNSALGREVHPYYASLDPVFQPNASLGRVVQRNATTADTTSTFRFVDCKLQTDTYAPLFASQCKQLLNVPGVVISPICNISCHPTNHNLSLGGTTLHKDRWILKQRLASSHRNDYKAAAASIMNHTNDQVFFAGMYNTEAEPSLITIHNAYAEMQTGRVQISADNTTYMIRFNQCGGDERRFSTANPRHRFDEAVLLTARWSHEYYHATVEQLPRLILLQEFLSQHSGVTILIQGDYSPKEESLFIKYANELGLKGKEHRIQSLRSDDLVFAKTLFIPEPTPCGHLQPSVAIPTQHMIQQTPMLPNNDRTIVLVRRRKSRAIQNHDGLMSALQTALPNETLVEFDEANMPPIGTAQWRVFSQAKLIIAPHGAALANLLACSKSTAVVEFMAEDSDFNICYASLATVLGLAYHPLAMNKTSSSSMGYYIVDVTHATKVIADIVNKMNGSGRWIT